MLKSTQVQKLDGLALTHSFTHIYVFMESLSWAQDWFRCWWGLSQSEGRMGTLGKQAGRFCMGYLNTLLDRVLCERYREGLESFAEEIVCEPRT